MSCHSTIRDAWSYSPYGNPMQAFSHLLSRTHFKINSWRRSGLNDIDSALINTKANISALELSDLSTGSQSLLLDQYARLVAL